MAAPEPTLVHISDLVRAALPEYLGEAIVIADVYSESLPGPDGDDYIRTTVILEDGHPELDARALNEFSLYIAPLCMQRGLDRPTIAYANRSEVAAPNRPQTGGHL